jgi:hypothetical protein
MARRYEREGAFNVATQSGRWHLPVTLLVSILLVGLGPGGESAGFLPWPYSGLVMLGGLGLGTLAFALFARRERYRIGSVVVDDEGARLGGELVPRASIKSAYYAPQVRGMPAAVRLLGDGDRVLARIAVRSHEEADEIMGALGLGPTQRAARFPAFAPRGSPSAYVALGLFLAGGAVMAAAIPLQLPWLIAVAVLVMIVGSAAFNPCIIHVGADGLLVGTRIGPRFVPWSEVVSLESASRGVVVRCKAEAIAIPTSLTVAANPRDEVAKQALLDRAHAALAAHRRGEEPDVAALLARRGRPHAEWVRALFHREVGFRTAPVLDDQLWSVVESATADATARAGAAAVLARAGGAAERERLRVAADGCAAPRLRAVLEKAADGASDAEVEAALLEVEADEDETRGA